MRYHTLCLFALLLSFSSSAFAQNRKVEYSAGPTSVPGQVRIVFEDGPALNNLLGQARSSTRELQQRLSGDCRGIPCPKVVGIDSAVVEQVSGHLNRWRIIINPDSTITRIEEYRNLMDNTWIRTIKELLPKNVDLVLKDGAKNWHTQIQLKPKPKPIET